MKKVTKIDILSDKLCNQKIKTACYVRVSTDSDEQLNSFDAQVLHYTNYIASNPDWEFVGIYSDSGISGTKKEIRPEFLRMISDCEAHKIDFIITKSISRFARNTADCLEVIRRFTELGIGVFFEKENINTLTTDSELMLSILSVLASSESASISKNNKWSIENRFKNGTYKLASPPYGYDWNGETLAPNKEQSEIVKRIFSEALSGRGTADIARELNHDGVPTQRNGKWCSTTIRGILKNEKVTGNVLHQKTYTDDNFNRHTNYGEQDQYYMENCHEAIISNADFEAVQKLLIQRAKEKGNFGEREKYLKRYLFTSRIVCNECGSTFKRKICTKNRNDKYIAWSCTTHIENKEACHMLSIKEEHIKNAFIVMLTKLHGFHYEILTPLLEEIKKLDSDGKVARIQEITKLITELHEQEQVITGLMSKGYLEPAIFMEQKSILQTELENLKVEKQTIINCSEGKRKIIAELENLLHYLKKTENISIQFDEDLFVKFVDRIIVFSKTEIGFQLKSRLCFKERIER